MLKLGQFELLESIGKGGMGEVWRAVDTGSGQMVAVKVVGVPQGVHVDQRVLFGEAQAMARLHHPNVATIWEMGRVSSKAAAQAPEQLPSGALYLVMEFVDGAPLTHTIGHSRWPQVRAYLLALLDALAHVHARGLIHRDLKPDNVLVCRGERGGWVPKLVDFGIAHQARDADSLATTDKREIGPIGTPAYMAPEQINADWREQGPWTDLYALGCMAWEMVCGNPPFSGANVFMLLHAHLQTPVPAFEPVVQVPIGFEAWLRRLLAKAPTQRPQWAADAAAALCALDSQPMLDLEVAPLTDGEWCDDAAPTLPMMATTTLPLDMLTLGRETGGGAGGTSAGAAATRPEELNSFERPPMPSTWRTSTSTTHSVGLLGAGLSLFGLRRIPVVDRTEIRDRLWARLCQVHYEGGRRAVLLRGPAGCGKSRIAAWLVERADEVGAAYSLRASHSANAATGPADGLVAMLSEHFRCLGLEAEQIERRVGASFEQLGLDGPLAEHDIRLLTQMLCAFDETASHQSHDPRERYFAVARYLAALGERRPVIVWLDDVQWGLDSLQFGRALLHAEAFSSASVLVVMTVRDDAVSSSFIESHLSELAALTSVESMGVEALTDGDQRELVQRLLGLEPVLAEHVVARSGGNPLFAVQLIGDWVSRGALALGDSGFVVRDEVESIIPDDLHMLWQRRVVDFLNSADSAERAQWQTALELAAVLGSEVVEAEWVHLCGLLGVPVSSAMVEQMVRRQLAELTGRGWRFAHGLLCESLERSVTGAGDWAGYNNLCAQMLLERHARPAPSVEARIGMHLLEAGERDDALDFIGRAAERFYGDGDYVACMKWIDVIERVGTQPIGGEGSASGDDPRLIRAKLLKAAYLHHGALDEATALLDEAFELASKCESTRLLALAHLERGKIAGLRGELKTAAAHCQKALALHRADHHAYHVAISQSMLAEMTRQQGRVDEALVHFTEALEIFEKLDEQQLVAKTYSRIAKCHFQVDRFEEASRWALKTLELAQALNHRQAEALGLCLLADIAMVRGDYEQARSHHEHAGALYEGIEPVNTMCSRLNVAFADIGAGDFERAERELEEVQQAVVEMGQRWLAPYTRLGLLCCVAHEARWQQWDELIDEYAAIGEQVQLCDNELAWLAEEAGRQACESGDAERGERALHIALEQARQLGLDERVERIEALLDEITAGR